jgi:hypothetical protein
MRAVSNLRQYREPGYSEGSASWSLDGSGETRLSDLIDSIAQEDGKSHRIAIFLTLYVTIGVIAMRLEYTAAFLLASVLLAFFMVFVIKRSKASAGVKDSYFQTTLVDGESWAASTVLMQNIHPRNVVELKAFMAFHSVPQELLAVCKPLHMEGKGIDLEGNAWVMYFAKKGVRKQRVNFLSEEMAVEAAVKFVKEEAFLKYGRTID